MADGSDDSISWTLCGASPQWTVTADSSSMPTVLAYPPQGDESRFSATQYEYFAGLPCVEASPTPGVAPAT